MIFLDHLHHVPLVSHFFPRRSELPMVAIGLCIVTLDRA